MKKLYVVGIGAGDYDGMTVGAVKVLEKAEVIVGYTVYCELVKPFFPDKEYISMPMMKELERCRRALESAADGRLTVMICSGDAGIYGMASPILELADEYGVEVEIVVGVTAACSGAALLGLLLTCDFTVISLSDLLTPAEVIERRIEGAAMSDICMVLYNPSSKKRADRLRRCCELLLKYRSSDTICGVAQHIGRDGEHTKLLTLGELAGILHSADELTVCVTTEYGEVMLDRIDGITIHTGRMDADEMARFFSDSRFDRIIDATHPYAEAVTENIQSAAGSAGIPVMRILREADRHIGDAVYVQSVEAARDYLIETDGNILVTTGAKELSSYIGLDMSRVWARVLPLASSLEACQAAGIPTPHIIAAQGPFTDEINLAQLRMIGARYMVTKASGKKRRI